jgi:hypothetical protein
MKGILRYHEPFQEGEYYYNGGWSLNVKPPNGSIEQTFQLTEDSLEFVLTNDLKTETEVEFDVISESYYSEEEYKGYFKFVGKIRQKNNKSKIFLIDIDGTICEDIKNEDSHLYPTAKVYPEALEIINKWYDEGNTIVFFTAREYKDKSATLAWLWKHGFKFNDLITDKPRIQDDQEYVWIDNRKVRAVTYLGTWSELKEVDAKIQIFQ